MRGRVLVLYTFIALAVLFLVGGLCLWALRGMEVYLLPDMFMVSMVCSMGGLITGYSVLLDVPEEDRV